MNIDNETKSRGKLLWTKTTNGDTPRGQPNPTIFISDLKERNAMDTNSSGNSEKPNWKGQNARKLCEAV